MIYDGRKLNHSIFTKDGKFLSRKQNNFTAPITVGNRFFIRDYGLIDFNSRKQKACHRFIEINGNKVVLSDPLLELEEIDFFHGFNFNDTFCIENTGKFLFIRQLEKNLLIYDKNTKLEISRKHIKLPGWNPPQESIVYLQKLRTEQKQREFLLSFSHIKGMFRTLNGFGVCYIIPNPDKKEAALECFQEFDFTGTVISRMIKACEITEFREHRIIGVKNGNLLVVEENKNEQLHIKTINL